MTESRFHVLLQRASYSSVGTLISRVLNAFTGIIIARAAGPVAFGVYWALWILFEQAATLTELGVATGLKRDGGRDDSQVPTLLGNALLIRTLTGALGLAVVLLVRGSFVSGDLAVALFLPLLLTGYSIAAVEPFFAVLQLRGEQRNASGLLVLRAVTLFGGVAVLARLDFDIRTLAWYQALISLCTLLFISILVYMRVDMKFSLRKMPHQIKNMLPFGISEMVYGFSRGIPALCLAYFASDAAVGLFGVAERFITIAILLGTAANNQAFLPALFTLFNSDRVSFTRVANRMQHLFLFLGAAGAATLYLSAGVIIRVLQGPEFEEAVGLLRLLAWGLPLAYTALASDAVMTASHYMRPKIIFQIIVSGVVLGLSLLLIPKTGPTGAVIAILGGHFTTMVLMVTYAHAKRLFRPSLAL